jgi:hypothetical protein
VSHHAPALSSDDLPIPAGIRPAGHEFPSAAPD